MLQKLALTQAFSGEGMATDRRQDFSSWRDTVKSLHVAQRPDRSTRRESGVSRRQNWSMVCQSNRTTPRPVPYKGRRFLQVPRQFRFSPIEAERLRGRGLHFFGESRR